MIFRLLTDSGGEFPDGFFGGSRKDRFVTLWNRAVLAFFGFPLPSTFLYSQSFVSCFR